MDRSVVLPVALSAGAAVLGTFLTHKLLESHEANMRFKNAKEERDRRQEAKEKGKEGGDDVPKGMLLEDVGIPNVYLWEVSREAGEWGAEGVAILGAMGKDLQLCFDCRLTFFTSFHFCLTRAHTHRRSSTWVRSVSPRPTRELTRCAITKPTLSILRTPSPRQALITIS